MRTDDTGMGGAKEAFPSTIWSDVLAAADRASGPGREKLERLCQEYWRPVYAYVRTAWRKSAEDAKDLTQAFFAHFLEKGYLARLDPGRGSFRGYLKRSLQHFLIDAQRAEAARAPATPLIRIDASPAEFERLAPVTESKPEAAFDGEWFRQVFDAGIDAMRDELTAAGKPVYFEVFRAYCLDPVRGGGADSTRRWVDGKVAPEPTYDEVAARFGLKESDVRNYLSHCRAALRRQVRARIRDYVAGDGDVDPEWIQVLGR